MAEQELYIVRLKDDFYRDGFNKVIVALLIIVVAFIFLCAVSAYLIYSKPQPVEFITDNEWRTLPIIPVNKPYLSEPDLLQWVSETLPSIFKYDFVNYNSQLANMGQYFTPDGWKKFLEIVNGFVSYDSIQTSKLFVNAVPINAPFILNQGVLDNRYVWWVQMSLTLNYISLAKTANQRIQLQVFVVRIPTLKNLDGVSIDNIVVKRI